MVQLLVMICMMVGCAADASVSIEHLHSQVSVVGTRLTSARVDGLGHRVGAAVGAPSRPERHSLARDLLRLDTGILLAEIAALCVWLFARAVGPASPERLRRSSWTRMCLIGVALAICPSSRANVLPLDLGAYRGKVIYLDVWASWCAPCRQSFPWMTRLQAELAPAGLIVIAVNVDRVRADAEQFLRARSPGFRVVYDPEGVIAEQFGVKGMPTSFVIDRDGTVRIRHEGFRRADEAAPRRPSAFTGLELLSEGRTFSCVDGGP